VEGPGCGRSQGGGPVWCLPLHPLSQALLVQAPRSERLSYVGTGPMGGRGGRAEHCLQGGSCVKVTLLEMACAQNVAFLNQENKKIHYFALLMESRWHTSA